MVRLIGIFLMFCFFATSAGATSEAEDFKKRYTEFTSWLKEVEALEKKNKRDLPFIVEVTKYLKKGTLVRPLPTGNLMHYDPRKEPHPPYILVLFPEDKKLAPIWKERYGEFQGGNWAFAQFIPENETIVLRAEKFSSMTRGAMLAHEGFHGVFFNKNNRQTKQTDEEFCIEEAMANAFEASLLMGASAEFDKRVRADAKKFAKTMFDKKGNLNIKVEFDEPFIVKVFGPILSPFDVNARGSQYSNAVLFGSMREHFNNDDRAFERFAQYLCSKYKQMGVR